MSRSFIHKRRTLAVAAGALAVGLLGWTAAGAAKPFKIGVLMPMSGGGASYGVPAVDGVKLAIQEINAAGGVNGAPVEFVVRDSKLKPSVAVAAAKELITKEGVDVLLGAISSGVTLAISEVAKQEHVVLFAPVAKTTKLTSDKLHKYVFQGSANSDVEASAIAKVTKKIGARKICATGFDYAYSHDLFAALKRALPKGVKISNSFLVKLGTTDYNALTSQLIASDCDTVVGVIWGGGFISFIKQATPFGLFKKKKFIWGAEVGSTEMAGKLGANFPNGMWANAYDLWYYNPTPQIKAYHKALAKLEGTRETNMWPITTYIGVKFLAAAANKAGSSNADALVTALEGLTIDTPFGARTLDAKTHRANTGELWGSFGVLKGKSPRMNSITYVD